MNIMDVDKLETEGVETTTGGLVFIEDPYILVTNDDRLPLVPGIKVALADGRRYKLIKRVARNARATIFRCTPINQEDPDHGSDSSPAD